jgi:ATPase subunit of ABC transporter with duplicated ATPase domains
MDSSHKVITSKLPLIIKKHQRYILTGPNGIGKSTLLKKLVNAHDSDAKIHDDIRVGYYSQDFNALDMDMIVRDSLQEIA